MRSLTTRRSAIVVFEQTRFSAPTLARNGCVWTVTRCLALQKLQSRVQHAEARVNESLGRKKCPNRSVASCSPTGPCRELLLFYRWIELWKQTKQVTHHDIAHASYLKIGFFFFIFFPRRSRIPQRNKRKKIRKKKKKKKVKIKKQSNAETVPRSSLSAGRYQCYRRLFAKKEKRFALARAKASFRDIERDNKWVYTYTFASARKSNFY